MRVKEKKTGRLATAKPHTAPNMYWIVFDDSKQIGAWAYSKEDF